MMNRCFCPPSFVELGFYYARAIEKISNFPTIPGNPGSRQDMIEWILEIAPYCVFMRLLVLVDQPTSQILTRFTYGEEERKKEFLALCNHCVRLS
jgi:hypothetical protein